MNPPLTPPGRGTDRTRTDACSPPGRGRQWVGSWKAFIRFCACMGTMNPPLTPPRRGYGQDADRCLFPSWEGSGVGRFMESRTGRKDNGRAVCGTANEAQLFNTLSAFLGLDARRIRTPFLASGLVAE